MNFSLQSNVQKAVGIIAAAMSLALLCMGVTVAEGGGIVFLVLVALLLAAISLCAFTARHEVIIDTAKGTVEKTYGALNFSVNQCYRTTDFNGVGIMMAGRSSAGGGADTVYYVQLLGVDNLKLPGGTTNLSSILSTARDVARHISLPLDDTPRMGFFGKRL